MEWRPHAWWGYMLPHITNQDRIDVLTLGTKLSVQLGCISSLNPCLIGNRYVIPHKNFFFHELLLKDIRQSGQTGLGIK
jgi:hypothetical protein